MAELSPGFNLSHYRILSKIAAGGMGEVYLAQDTKLDRKVALKILPAEVASNRERMERFIREAKSAAALSHPKHRADFRNRRARWHAFHRHGVHRWADFAREDSSRANRIEKGVALPATRRRRIGESSRPGVSLSEVAIKLRPEV